MRDLTAVVPWAKSVIKIICVFSIVTSCSPGRFINNKSLNNDEYAVIDAYFRDSTNIKVPFYYKTSKDRKWGQYLEIEFMESEGFFNRFNLTKNELEMLLPQELLNEFKAQVENLKIHKLEKEELQEIEPVKSLKRAEYWTLSKPIIIKNIAIFRMKATKHEPISIVILTEKDGTWYPRHLFWEKYLTTD